MIGICGAGDALSDTLAVALGLHGLACGLWHALRTESPLSSSRMPNLATLHPRSSSLADDLRRAAHDHLQACSDHRFADAQFIAKGAFLVVVSALLYGAMVTATNATAFVLAYVAFRSSRCCWP